MSLLQYNLNDSNKIETTTTVITETTEESGQIEVQLSYHYDCVYKIPNLECAECDSDSNGGSSQTSVTSGLAVLHENPTSSNYDDDEDSYDSLSSCGIINDYPPVACDIQSRNRYSNEPQSEDYDCLPANSYYNECSNYVEPHSCADCRSLEGYRNGSEDQIFEEDGGYEADYDEEPELEEFDGNKTVYNFDKSESEKSYGNDVSGEYYDGYYYYDDVECNFDD